MATPRPGKGTVFAPGPYTHSGYQVTLGANGRIDVKAGDMISKYSACLYQDPLMGWEEFGRMEGGVVKALADPNAIRVGETLYHIPTWSARDKPGQGPPPVKAPGRGDTRLRFDGKTLEWIPGDGSPPTSMRAVSGLRSHNPTIDRLIRAGRQDIRRGVDYTDPKYQDLPGAGPIPEGEYFVALKKDAPFERIGGGWGVGAWPLRPTSRTGRALEWLDTWVDVPGVRNGFFLHQDGGDDGTAGCVGVIRTDDVLWLQEQFSKLHDEGHRRVIVRVKYGHGND